MKIRKYMGIADIPEILNVLTGSPLPALVVR